MFIMEKQKIFLFLIAAGAIFILLQQSSQITTVNNHFVANNNNISSLSYNSSISIIKNHQNGKYFQHIFLFFVVMIFFY